MSGAVAGFALKALTGAIIGKTVGKVTGNDKLGMVAALVSGSMVPGAGLAEGAGGILEQGVGLVEEYPGAAKIAAGIGGGLISGGVQGYAQGKETEAANERARLQREQDIKLQQMQADEAALDYARRHEGFSAAAPSAAAPSAGGLLSTPTAAAKPSITTPTVPVAATPTPAVPVAAGPTAAQEYFQQYRNMYGGGGVR